MTSIDDHITDPLLVSVLSKVAQARQQSQAIIDLIEDFHASSDTETTTALLTLSKQQKTLNTQLTQLRSLNRQAIQTVRSTKQETTEARQEIDTLHLELQNLYYEQRHLRGEITACQDYAHTYEQISMIELEEFLALKPEMVSASEHDLTIARIEDEQKRRLALEEQKQGLLRQKEVWMKETTAKREELARLDAEMEKWVKGQESVRKHFEVREKLADAAGD